MWGKKIKKQKKSCPQNCITCKTIDWPPLIGGFHWAPAKTPGHWLGIQVAGPGGLCSLTFRLLQTISPGLHLSLPWLPLACFKNIHSTSMHTDISVLELVLQLLTLRIKILSLLCFRFSCTHILSKCQMSIIQLLDLEDRKAESECQRQLSKVCAQSPVWTGGGGKRSREGGRKLKRKLTKVFTVVGCEILYGFVFFSIHLIKKPVYEEPHYFHLYKQKTIY